MHDDEGKRGTTSNEMANNYVHKTKPALFSFSIFLSHKVWWWGRGSLPVVRARVRLVTHGVSGSPNRGKRETRE